MQDHVGVWDLLSRRVMLTRPSDEIWALNSLRGMHKAVLLQDAVMNYYSFPYGIMLLQNSMHGYKQFSFLFVVFFFFNTRVTAPGDSHLCSNGRTFTNIQWNPNTILKSEHSALYWVFVHVCRRLQGLKRFTDI